MTVVVLDASVLSTFARTGRLELLERILAEFTPVTTAEVLDEIRAGVSRLPELAPACDLDWLGTVRLEGLPSLGVFAEYAKLLGSGTHGDVGEATVLAWAELNDAIAIVDETAAREAGKRRGVRFHGTLWLVSEGIRRGVLDLKSASALIDQFCETGARLPCNGSTFEAWATRHGLLDE